MRKEWTKVVFNQKYVRGETNWGALYIHYWIEKIFLEKSTYISFCIAKKVPHEIKLKYFIYIKNSYLLLRFVFFIFVARIDDWSFVKSSFENSKISYSLTHWYGWIYVSFFLNILTYLLLTCNSNAVLEDYHLFVKSNTTNIICPILKMNK